MKWSFSISIYLSANSLPYISLRRSVSMRRFRRMKFDLGSSPTERSHVLVLHVGIGVELASCRGVRSIAVLHEELQLVAHLPILGMPLAIKHISLGYRVVTLGHERDLHLVLDLLDRDAVGHADPAQDVGDHVLRSETPDRKECLGDRPLNLLPSKTPPAFRPS